MIQNMITSIVGARIKDLLILEDEIKKNSDEFYVATDDGSKGTKGFVSNVLQKLIDDGKKIDVVWAIGPVIMMKVVADVTKKPFPRINYDVITLFEAIEHFFVEAGTRLLQKIAASLSSTKGTLIGSTPILANRGGYNPEHDNEFLSMEQLRLFLEYHFVEVALRSTKWPTRNACYFICSRPILLSEEKTLQVIQQYRGFING